VRRWIRNAAIGAGLLSYKGVLAALGSMVSGNLDQLRSNALLSAWLIAAGVTAGLAFTGLEPLRARSSGGRYLGWILSAYVALGVLLLVAISAGDEMAAAMVVDPLGIGFLLVCATLGGIMAARAFGENGRRGRA